MSDAIPLDPNEGPSIWLNKADGNGHTHTIVLGTDPDDPYKSFTISSNEVERLYNSIDQ
jgi:hypothetical protein